MRARAPSSLRSASALQNRARREKGSGKAGFPHFSFCIPPRARHNGAMSPLAFSIALFVALGLAGLLVMEVWRWRRKCRAEGPEAYPRRRLLRRAASVLLLEGAVGLIAFSEWRSDQGVGPWLQVATLCSGLALSLGALLIALRDLRESAKRAAVESERAAAQALERLQRALREQGLNVEFRTEPGGQRPDSARGNQEP